MKFVKRDVCLWDSKKSSADEIKMAQKGLKDGELKVKFNGMQLLFAPMNGAKGLKPVGGATKEWNTTKYGTTVELVIEK